LAVQRERLGAPDIGQRVGIDAGAGRIGDLEDQGEGDDAEQRRREPAREWDAPVGIGGGIAQNDLLNVLAPEEAGRAFLIGER